MTQPNFKDLTGQKFGKLTVLRRDMNDCCGRAQWLCRCECGEELVVQGNSLRNNKITCCWMCKEKGKISNFEKIKQMTVDEMAEFIYELTNSGEYTCCYCKPYNDQFKDNREFEFICNMDCKDGVAQWLLQEVDE